MITLDKVLLFTKILIAIVVGWIVSIIISNCLFLAAPIFHGVICVFVFLPAIVIGFVIFLIVVKFKGEKYATAKKINRFSLFLLILIVIVYTLFASYHISPTYMGNLDIHYMDLSSDGSKLLTISSCYTSVISPETGSEIYPHEAILWNTNSGEKIWRLKTEDYTGRIEILPLESYLLFEGYYWTSPYLYHLDENKTYPELSGDYHDYLYDGKIIVTDHSNYHNRSIIWDAINGTVIRTIWLNDTVEWFYTNSNGSKLVTFEELNNRSKRISMLDISTENIKYLWGKHFNKITEFDLDRCIFWSENGEKVQLIFYNQAEDYKEQFHIEIRNVSNGELLEENVFISDFLAPYISHFGVFALRSSVTKIEIYDISGLIQTIDTEFKHFDFEISSDKTTIAYSNSKIVEIRNISTGKLINTLYFPIYEIERATPGFELFIFIIAIFFTFLYRHKLK
jgi:hypothetical protein